MRFKQSKIYAERIQATSRQNKPDPYDSAINKTNEDSSPEIANLSGDPDSSPDNVIKRIIRNTRKSQERMQKALCQKLAHSIQQSMQIDETKESNNTIQMKRRPSQINTTNSTKAAVS